MRFQRAVVLAASFCLVGAIGSAYGQAREPLGLRIKAIPSSINKGDNISSATLSGSGLLALGTASGNLFILDRNLRSWGGGWKRSADSTAIFGVAFSQDEAAIAGASLGAVVIWRLNDPTVVKMKIPLKEPPPAMALSTGGRWLALANFSVFVFDVSSQRLVRKFEQETNDGGNDEYAHLAFTPDSAVVAAASDNIDAWNIESGKRVRHWRCNCDANGVTFSRDAALAVIGTGDARALLVDLASESVLKYKTMSILEGDHVYGTAVSLKGTLVAAGTAAGAVVVWDTVSGVIIARARPSGQPIVRITSSDDGQLLLVEGQKAEYVRGNYDRWLMTLTRR